jgi:hypothetical protein
MEIIVKFNYKIIYKKELKNKRANALSWKLKYNIEYIIIKG